MMTTIKHGRATFTVKPEHAQAVHDLLALIDKSKGKRGAKLDRPKGIDKSKGKRGAKLDLPKGIDKHDSAKRDYPIFNPSCMLTSDYVTAYTALNSRLHLNECAFEPTINRTPPGYDPACPVCVEEVLE